MLALACYTYYLFRYIFLATLPMSVPSSDEMVEDCFGSLRTNIKLHRSHKHIGLGRHSEVTRGTFTNQVSHNANGGLRRLSEVAYHIEVGEGFIIIWTNASKEASPRTQYQVKNTFKKAAKISRHYEDKHYLLTRDKWVEEISREIDGTWFIIW